MKNYIEFQILKARYSRLLAKCERQRKQITMLEQSRSDMRRNLADCKAHLTPRALDGAKVYASGEEFLKEMDDVVAKNEKSPRQ